MGLVFRHPELGERVGDYRIVEKLGSGGFGTVFKAERAGLFFSVKMLRSLELGARARREIGILLLLDHPGVARFRACDRWLDPKRGTPYIVTDFVPGMTLEEFARVENPSARKSARIILECARTLGDIHRQGVFHRDLKPENILIQGQDERPVLIDFGVGTYAGAPIVTPYGLQPGTYEFRAPEAYLFNRANTGLAHYEFSAADELWALGVTFYWLLTDVLPFGDRNDWEGGDLTERILHQEPVAPHVLNPRVPRVLSDLCMKMLEKKPEDRYASMVELCVALGGVMADAELDGGWDLPLFDPDAPGSRTTGEAPARSRAPRATAASRPPVSRQRARLAAAAGLAVVVLAVSLAAGALLARPEPVPLHTSSEAAVTRQAESGHEVASPWKPLESAGGAVPVPGTPTPAPFAIAMLPKDETSLKTEETRAPTTRKQGLRSTLKKGCVGAACCATLTGCPGAQVQQLQVVRSTPPPEPCPAGAVETMESLGIPVGHARVASFIIDGDLRYLTVREGDITLDLVGDWGKLPQTTLLSGRLIFGDKRVYGRLTEASVPGAETYKVCLEIRDLEGGRGTIREPGGGPESARVFSSVRVKAVSSFE